MKIRILYNYLLNFLGLREMLPGEILRSKPVRENNEPMVAVRSGDGIFVDGGGVKFCRASVADKLRNVAEKLKGEGYGIYVYDLYRSPDEQLERRRKTVLNLKEKFADERELEVHLRRSTAGIGGGHQSGGAVDLTLCDMNGNPVDMGSMYPAKCPEMATSYKVSMVARKHRKTLLKAMCCEGFVNYPAEWWHFSYGDQMWAAYRFKRYAIYGVKNSV